ncbi:MAG TPA: hypothetical protein VGG37_01525 [Opitutaceae bacterium]|jgi:hypothetical protein
MNTTTFPIKAFLAALAGAALLPVGPGFAALAFTASGLLALLASDYGRTLEPIRASAQLLPFRPAPKALAAAA